MFIYWPWPVFLPSKMNFTHKLFKILSGHGFCIKCYCYLDLRPKNVSGSSTEYDQSSYQVPWLSHDVAIGRTDRRMTLPMGICWVFLLFKTTQQAKNYPTILERNECSHRWVFWYPTSAHRYARTIQTPYHNTSEVSLRAYKKWIYLHVSTQFIVNVPIRPNDCNLQFVL